MIIKDHLLKNFARGFCRKNMPENTVEDNQTTKTEPQPRESIYLGEHKALTKTIWGQKIFVDTRDISLAPHILLEGSWEMWITKIFMNTVKEGMTVVEIGANIGYYTLLAASLIGPRGKIFAFEADADISDILFQSIVINGFLDRITLINKAVCDKTGRLKFYKPMRFQGDGSISDISGGTLKFQKPIDQIKTVEVDTVSLDDYFREDIPKIDVIKIDAEGSEALIFKGMKKILERNPCITIITEFTPQFISGTGENPRNFLKEVIHLGFRLRIIDTDSCIQDVTIDKLSDVPQCELFLSR